MATYCVSLRCMNDSGVLIQSHGLPDQGGVSVHTILRSAKVDEVVRTELGDYIESGEDVLGFLLTGGPVVQFSPVVRNVSVEDLEPGRSGSQRQYRETKMLAESSSTIFRRLRHGDIVHFCDDNLKIEIQVSAADTGASPTAIPYAIADSIQVKSSVPEREVERSPSKLIVFNNRAPTSNLEEHNAASEDDTNSESEGDLNRESGSVATPARKSAEVTPPTSLHPVEGTVKDTPARPDSRASDQFFSTAPGDVERAENDSPTGLMASLKGTATLQFAASPSVRAAESQERRVQKESRCLNDAAGSGAILGSIVNESVTLVADDDGHSDNVVNYTALVPREADERRTRVKIDGRHNRHSRHKMLEVAESLGQKISQSPSSASSPANGSELELANHLTEHATSGKSTSDNIADDQGVITDAILRSQASQGSKRRMSEVMEELEVNGTKRQKQNTTKDVDVGDSDTNGESIIVHSRGARESRAEARRRLLSSQSGEREEATNVDLLESFPDEIVVSTATARRRRVSNDSAHPRSSPQVRVPRIRTSETPTPPAHSALDGHAPQVLLSNTTQSNNSTTMKWLKKQGARVVDEIPSRETDFVCVIGNGTLVKTSKLLRTITFGKPILTDKWLIDSKKAGHLVAPDGYQHGDLVDIAVEDRSTLFVNKTLFFTNKLVTVYNPEGWKNIQLLCQDAGASAVTKGAASRAAALVKSNGNVILLGHDDGDNDAMLLLQDGHTVFKKDFLTHVVISGTLNMNDDKYKLQAGDERKGKKAQKK